MSLLLMRRWRWLYHGARRNAQMHVQRNVIQAVAPKPEKALHPAEEPFHLQARGINRW